MAGCPICEDLHHGASGCPHSLVGHTLGNYRVASFLAAGGMGAVYVGEHQTLGSPVAVKTLHRAFLPQNAKTDDRRKLAETLVRRFTDEARRAASLRHANIVRVEDLGVAPDGTPYLAMEFLEGTSLKALLETSGPLDPARAAELIAQALDGLDFAHQRNIIHRDIKPENLYLQHPGTRGEVVKVLDFGIAKAIGDGATQLGLTQTGHGAMGTFYYMSPEQAADPRKVTASSDVYSIGASLFELLTGKNVLFEIERELTTSGLMAVQFLHGVLSAIMEGSIERHPRKVRPEIPEWLDAIVARSLAHDPAARFASAGEMAAALHDGAAGKPVASSVALAATAPSLPMAASGGRQETLLGTHVAPAVPDAERPSAKMAAARASQLPLGTTSGESAGERVEPLAPAKSGGRGLLVGLAAVAVIAAAGVLFALAGGAGDPETSASQSVDAQTVAPVVDAAPAAAGFDDVIRLARSGDCAAAAGIYDGITNSDDAGARADALVALGECEAASQPDEARARFDRALALVADHPGARRGLAALPEAEKPPAPPKTGKRPSPPPESPDKETIGLLFVTSRPPCRVLVDGRNTGKRTPAKIELEAGEHQVTLINRVRGIKKTVPVTIRAKAVTRVREDFADQTKAGKPEPGCDEVGCLVDPDKPCCGKLKSEKPRPDPDLPERLSRTDVQRGMRGVTAGVKACAEPTGFKGSIRVRVAISPEGRVASAAVSGTAPGPIAACVTAAVKRARFPKTQQPLTVNYPFVF